MTTDREIVLQAPPTLPRGGGGSSQLLFMLPMTLGMGVMAFAYIGRSSGTGTIVFGGLFVIVMAGMVVMALSRGGAAKKAQINDDRRDYLRYLAGLRETVRRAAGEQRTAMLTAAPDPENLWTVIGTPRMWRRPPTDPAFGRVRVGLGPQRLARSLRAPQTAPLDELDPVSATSLRHFIRTYATVPALPVAVSLRAFTRITLGGDPVAARDLGRAVLAHLATMHAPTEMRIAVCAGPERAAEWSWTKWLPHLAHPTATDAAGPVRLFGERPADLAPLLAGDLAGRPRFQPGSGAPAGRVHLVVLADPGTAGAREGTAGPGTTGPWEGLAGVTVVTFGEPEARTAPGRLDLAIADGRLGTRRREGVTLIGVPDRLGAASAEAAARQLAAWYQPAPAAASGPRPPAELTELLGLGDPHAFDPGSAWQPRAARDRLRIPIGVDPDGAPVELDLKESAEGGMGPHGLVIGATGSGKSELLRTLVTALVATHSSATLNLALIDFKGGATFTGMAGLPHTCAVITNLAAELTLVDRMGDALRGEMVRRQELLRAAGDFASVRDYEQARRNGARLDPLPSLLVVIDEFSELLAARPEFTELFVAIGRLGRSLAIHLLFASQRLEEGRLRGLDSHLSYRIGLRTFSAAESRTVLGVPDAHQLPPRPGAGYLRRDTSTLQRFQAAYVSGPAVATSTATGGWRDVPAMVPFTLTAQAALARPEPPVALSTGPSTGPSTVDSGDTPGFSEVSVMAALLGRIEGRGPAAHAIWLPPLSDPPTVGELVAASHETRELVVPVGIIDKPFEQRRDVLRADFSGGSGHGVVVGAPQSGKSTLLRSVVSSFALTHTPRQVQFFLLDFGGGGLGALAGLPHVSGAAGRLEPGTCRRVVAEVAALLDEREESFPRYGIDSAAAFRRNPPPAEREFGDVFLVIDGWMTLRQEFEDLEETVQTIAARGLGFGVHVLLSANRWMELRPALRDAIGTVLELRLGDPADSAIDRRAAGTVPSAPGRGLTGEKHHFLAAVPRCDGRRSGEGLAAAVREMVEEVRTAWNGPPAPPVRLLPRSIPAAELPAGGRTVPIGIAERDLRPVCLDFDADPHLIVFGDGESGKTALLRLIAFGLMQRRTPAQAAILTVDYRRGLLDVVTGEHLLTYAGAEPALTAVMGDVAQGVRNRLPGPEVTADRLRRRDWWTGPELFVIVDDYDLVAGQGGNPLLSLLDLLPQARDVGLHLIVARRTGGAGRAMFEPLLQRLRELGTPGVLLSGSREEGALLGGVKAAPRPPGQGVHIDRHGSSSVLQVAWQEG
ncbi:type VII secretion protein EccCa [Actinoplanes sp. NPDC051851]|uniref:type VII secretion protein EccCa n=1 Tax=Actinoplanes sp. NPDC051851 TaxID=3154753 RepID=UPI0034298A0E